MGELKEKALEKMLQEMNAPHSASEDRIHNWLCDQVDNEVLMQNILKEGKTIKGALNYAKSMAQKEADHGVAVIDDVTVYAWVVEYFASDKKDTTVQPKSQSVQQPIQQPKPKKETKVEKAAREKEEALAKEKVEAELRKKVAKKQHIVEGQIGFDDLFSMPEYIASEETDHQSSIEAGEQYDRDEMDLGDSFDDDDQESCNEDCEYEEDGEEE